MTYCLNKRISEFELYYTGHAHSKKGSVITDVSFVVFGTLRHKEKVILIVFVFVFTLCIKSVYMYIFFLPHTHFKCYHDLSKCLRQLYIDISFVGRA